MRRLTKYLSVRYLVSPLAKPLHHTQEVGFGGSNCVSGAHELEKPIATIGRFDGAGETSPLFF